MRFRGALQLLLLPSLATAQQCLHPAGAPSLDHLVLVAPDLDGAERRLVTQGFSFTPGHLHPDGLRNGHIRLADGSELELMTVSGLAGDADAQDYANLLAQGEGGAYLALAVADIHPVAAQARRLGLAIRESNSGSWRSLRFPPPSAASGILFVQGVARTDTADSVLTHPNGAIGLAEGWLEGGAGLDSLLGALHAAPCGRATAPDGRLGTLWGLARGAVVVVRPRAAGRLPRPIGAVLTRRVGAEPPTMISVPGFWIRFIPDKP